ncbi:tryptophan--tRNA ligase [Guggenheimella bovis]
MKQRIFSGVQPSGSLTIGNYLGALRNWARLQDDYEAIYSIVDMHAITVRQDPELLRKRTLTNLALYIASGVDPEKNTFFIQSHVKEHAELSWILNCFTYMGELSRMTQFKDKSKNLGDSIGVGLFTYPVLMAADILLYQTDLVPVGDDQSQHVEITRDIAERFNNLFGPTFKMPKTFLNSHGSRIYDLQDPTKKMSKSEENSAGVLFLSDDEKTLRKKIARSVTDNIGKIQYNDEQPGVKNLLNIYSLITEKNIDECLAHFDSKGYKALKDDVTDAVLSVILPLQERVNELLAKPAELEEIYRLGAKHASEIAKETLDDVKTKIGFIL